MGEVRILSAFGEGFKLIARAPGAVLLWGLVTIVLALIPYLAMVGGITPALSGEDPAAAMTALSATGPLVQLLQFICTVVTAGFVYSAVYRAVLRPQDKGFGYLKAGLEEVYVAVVFLVFYILMVIVAIVVGIAIVLAVMLPAGIGSMLDGGEPSPGAILLAIPLVLFTFLGLAIPGVRLGMALPMTFAERKIHIFEAWTFTKGHTWGLYGMFLLQILMIIGIYVAFILVVVLGAGAAAIGGMSNLGNDPAALGAILPLIGVVLILAVILSFVITPILYAPWAKAYELIAEAKEGGKADVFS